MHIMKKIVLNPLVMVMLVALTVLACSSKYAGYDKSETGLYYKLYKTGTPQNENARKEEFPT